jgi:predicted acyl esterase
VRHPGEKFEKRYEEEWPLACTDWTPYYLDAGANDLSTEEPAESTSTTYEALGDGVTFLSDPLEAETEITGPISSKLFVSSDTEDADLFVVVRLFDENMEEIVFQGSNDPHTPIALGWLRASHRKLDPDRSEEYRPYHTHDEEQPLTPGEIYEVDIEVWPTCIVAPPGSRIGFSIRGKDYEYPGDPDNESGYTGVGPFEHNDPRDRPVDVYGGDVTIHTGPEYSSRVLLPVIPDDS